MNTFEKGNEYVMNTYSRFPLVLTEGKGMYAKDSEGKEYLDFVAGIAVNSLGHGNEKLCNAIYEQSKKLIHVSNLYWTNPQIELAEKLVENSCFSKVFFCNSGAESIEGALKLSRKYAQLKGNEDKNHIITMINSFHGRTYGAVSATGQPKYQKGLTPLLPNISHVEFNNFEALEKAVTENTCAIFIEPLQGEGGIHPAQKAYLQKVRALCDEKDICLVFDEIQCGVGRLGTLFAYEYFGVEPDICVWAKGLAGGVPIGAMMAKEHIAKGFNPGDHASTFGGNPLAAAAGNLVVDELLSGVLENVKHMGEYLTEKLNGLKKNHSQITDVRGIGLMQGMELSIPVSEVVSKAMENGLLLVNAGPNIIRFVPALIVSKEDIDKCIDILDKILD